MKFKPKHADLHTNRSLLPSDCKKSYVRLLKTSLGCCYQPTSMHELVSEACQCELIKQVDEEDI